MAKSYIGTNSPIFAVSPKDVPYAGTVEPQAIIETFSFVNYNRVSDAVADNYDSAFSAFKTAVVKDSVTASEFESALSTFSSAVIKELGDKYKSASASSETPKA